MLRSQRRALRAGKERAQETGNRCGRRRRCRSGMTVGGCRMKSGSNGQERSMEDTRGWAAATWKAGACSGMRTSTPDLLARSSCHMRLGLLKQGRVRLR